MTTLRYEWTPASEPPDSTRPVQIWISDGKKGTWCDGCITSTRNNWIICDDQYAMYGWDVTHWRDVAPPTATPHTA